MRLRFWLSIPFAGFSGSAFCQQPILSNQNLHVEAVAPNVLRITDWAPTGFREPTPMLLEKGLRAAKPIGSIEEGTLKTSALNASFQGSDLVVTDPDNQQVLSVEAGSKSVTALYPSGENLYGMRGIGLFGPKDARMDRQNGLLRNQGAPVAAGSQGDGGAPLAFTTRWGLLVDSIDGLFTTTDGKLSFDHGSRSDLECYIVVGSPKETLAAVAALTGRPPIPPKWALGFMNSQWGDDQKEVLEIVDRYNKEQIPLDAMILDFDCKAWGEDDYGELRWNSTGNSGNVAPDKFPDGASGLFAKQLQDKGVRMAGIMKPRLLVTNTEGLPTKAADEANAHSWFLPGQKPYKEYFSGRLANDVDFSKPDARVWYWQHSRNLFLAGFAGWWNDEADDGFPSLGFFDMQRSLYDGQRSESDQRVWSINRNFYLGAQRYAFATWSGDIRSGFASMKDQALRMLTLTNLGQANWSMDGGGFNGHPSPENYARWIEFESMVPVMRVHGTFGQKRQPWVYGPVAQAAATKAIELRHALFPTLYSIQRKAYEDGVGIVRPLFWEFPEDPQSANLYDEWMVGDSLLAAPVLEQGQTVKTVYLPPGTWYRYGTDEELSGGKKIELQIDSNTWSDLPLFVRSGSIIATQGKTLHVAAEPVQEITLDVWPDSQHPATFDVYDDDGQTYGYENGRYFSQLVTTSFTETGALAITFAKPAGSFKTTIQRYRVRLHGSSGAATLNRKPAKQQGDAFVVPAGKQQVLTVGEVQIGVASRPTVGPRTKFSCFGPTE